MTRTFIQTNEFSKQWDALGLNDDDLQNVESEILENPKAYPVIRGTGALRKIRVALPGKGKSGGARVCYVDFVYAEVVYMITVYPKSEKDNLSPEEKAYIKKGIEVLKRSLKGEIS